MRNMLIKKNIIRNLYFILFFSVFIISYQIRGIFVSGKIQSLNMIAIAVIFFIVSNKNTILKKRYIFFIGILTLSIIYSQSINNKSFMENMVVISCIIIPMSLIFIYINKIKFEKIFFLYVKYFNYIVIILFIFAIIDRTSGDIIAKMFASIFNDQSFREAVNSPNNIRYYSFMGHPLYNTQLFLMFYVLNSIVKKYFPEKQKIKMLYVVIITVFGVLFTASKTGMVLTLILLVFMMPYKNKKISYLILTFILLIILYKLGFFDNLIYRLTTQTLTSGRNEVWAILKQNDIFPIKFWYGYGSGFNNLYNYYIKGASMAFEYPFKLFQLEYGILNDIFIYIIIFIYPMYNIVRSRQCHIFIGFIVIFIDVNTYNGIGLGMDIMMMFCLFIHMILNLVNYLKTNDKNKINFI